MKFFSLLLLSFSFVFATTFADVINALKDENTTEIQKIILTKEDANLALENKKSVLMYSVWVGNIQAVETLVARGADINAQDIDGKTALMLALYAQRTEIAIFLIQTGADLNLVSNDEQSALSMMGAKDKKELLDILQQ